jgi:putative membrane protein
MNSPQDFSMDGQANDEAGKTSPPNQLALERTRLAFERTQLAWERTATGLITFGFSLHKFFQYQQTAGIKPPHRFLGAHDFALLMIGTGLIALLLSTIDHTINIRQLRRQYGPVPRSLAGTLAGLISLLGILGLLEVLFQH